MIEGSATSDQRMNTNNEPKYRDLLEVGSAPIASAVHSRPATDQQQQQATTSNGDGARQTQELLQGLMQQSIVLAEDFQSISEHAQTRLKNSGSP